MGMGKANVQGTSKRAGHVTQAERDLRKFLATIPYPWSIEQGSKHKQVKIDGRSVGVICISHGKTKDARQIIDAVKRRIREIESQRVCQDGSR